MTTTMPGFTAEVALRPAARAYARGYDASSGDATMIAPQDGMRREKLGYACRGTSCACSGDRDCRECLIDGFCVGPCTCDVIGTCIC